MPLLRVDPFNANPFQDQPRDTVALDERIDASASDRLEWRATGGEGGLFDVAAEAASVSTVSETEASEEGAVVATDAAQESPAAGADANVTARPSDAPQPELPLVLSRFATDKFEPGLPVGPPAGETSSLSNTEAAEEAVPYDLTTLISDALAALKSHLTAWVEFFNLLQIDWAAHGGTALALPVMPDALSDLFDLATRLSAYDFPTLAADSAEALVDELAGHGFTITAIEGGLNTGGHNIAATTGTDRILGTFTVSLAAGFGTAAGYTGETFDTASEGLLDGLGSGLATGDTLGFTGDLSLALHFGVDDTGFFVAGTSALIVDVSASGNLNGTADVLGATDSAVAIAASVDLAVTLGFADSGLRYRLDSIPAGLGSMLIAKATGTAEAKLSFTHGPTDLEFTAHYTLSAVGFTVTQTLALDLTGTLELPGFTFASNGQAAALDLTGTYNSVAGTWTLNAATANLKAFGFAVNSASFSVTASTGAFSGTGTASMEIDFLSHSSQPATFDLAASFDASTLTIDATLSLADLVFGGNGGGSVFSTGAAHLTLALSGNFTTSALTGTLSFDLASATLSPAQSTYSASFTDGSDADAFALTGSYVFETGALTLTGDQFELLVAHVVKATAAGAVLSYNRTSPDDDQDLLTLSTLDVELLAFADAGTGTAPLFHASTIVLRESGFSIANGTLSAADLRIGGFLHLATPSLTVTGLGYASGVLTGTFSLTTSSATLFPDASALTVTLSDGVDADAFALHGTFDASTTAFALTVDQFALTVPQVLSADGSGMVISYSAGSGARQELFNLENLTLTFLSLKAGSADLTASISKLSLYTDGFEVEDIALPAATAPPLGQVQIGSFLELTNPTLNISGLKYDGTLAGTITITTDAAVLFPGSTAFTATLSDGSDANTYALNGTFDVATLAFALTVDQFALTVPNVFAAAGSGMTIAYNPGVSGRQELFALNSLTLTFLSLKTASGVDLTASVSKLGIYTDGFEVDDISLPAVSAPALGQVRIGSFLELTNPTLNIAGLKYDGALAGTITLTTDAAVLFPGS
ncbi:MAG: hypothetical protein NDI75_09185, partial [Candidatus Didemnitutus sp.]|nr:hypothetical protein [Candidatus Didemnitutus sp.]